MARLSCTFILDCDFDLKSFGEWRYLILILNYFETDNLLILNDLKSLLFVIFSNTGGSCQNE